MKKIKLYKKYMVPGFYKNTNRQNNANLHKKKMKNSTKWTTSRFLAIIYT